MGLFFLFFWRSGLIKELNYENLNISKAHLIDVVNIANIIVNQRRVDVFLRSFIISRWFLYKSIHVLQIFPCWEDLKTKDIEWARGDGTKEKKRSADLLLYRHWAQTQHQRSVHLMSALLQTGWRSAVSETSKHQKKQTFKLQPDLPGTNFNLYCVCSYQTGH